MFKAYSTWSRYVSHTGSIGRFSRRAVEFLGAFMHWLDLPESAREFILDLFVQVKKHDQETFEHCSRVGQNSRLLARAAGLAEVDQRTLEYAGLFHDIGKAKIPTDILLKPGKLTDDEYTTMKDHPVLSSEMMDPLTKHEFFLRVQPGVLHHHERVDGAGYPYGLASDAIPLASRIILIADTYDAMTSSRSYRKGLPKEVAYQELKKFSGVQFDARLVKIFLEAHPHFDQDLEMIYEDDGAQRTLKAA